MNTTLGLSRARISVLLGSLALASSLAAQGSTARARTYELTILTPPPGAFATQAACVNSLGQAVGVVNGNPSTAFVWQRATGLVPLAPLAGFSGSYCESINRQGFVAGASFTPANTFATLWTPSGTALSIPVPGATTSSARSVNNHGVVLLGAQVGGQWTTYVWDALNGARDLASFGLSGTTTLGDLNEADQVAGGQPYGQAFRLDLATSTVTYLGTLGGEYSAGMGLNDDGDVVGWAHGTTFFYVNLPFLWTPSRGMRYLGTLNALTAPGGVAYSVNTSDVVVGASAVDASHSHAFVWDDVHGMRDLNDIVRGRGPYELVSASHVSNSGWIVGKAQDTSAGNATVGFVLRPQ